MPQPTTVIVRTIVKATETRYGESGSGRIQKKNGIRAQEAPTQATYRKGRCTARVKTATRVAPPALFDTMLTADSATARPMGHRLRSHTEAQARAPSHWSRSARPSEVFGSFETEWAPSRPMPTATPKEVKSTTQSRRVRRLRPGRPSGSRSSSSATAEGSILRRHRYRSPGGVASVRS